MFPYLINYLPLEIVRAAKVRQSYVVYQRGNMQ